MIFGKIKFQASILNRINLFKNHIEKRCENGYIHNKKNKALRL